MHHQQSTQSQNNSEDGVQESLSCRCDEKNPQHSTTACRPFQCHGAQSSSQQSLQCCRQNLGVGLSSIQCKSLALRLAVFVSVFYYVAHSLLSSSSYLHRLDDAERMYDEMIQAQESIVQQLKEANQVLLSEKKQLVDEFRILEQNARDQIKKIQRDKDSVPPMESTLSSQVDLQVNIQNAAKKAVIEEYGEGPHLVEIEVRTWEHGSPYTRFFSVELAPVDEMPLAVQMFLEHVRRDLWSRTSFYLNTEQSIVARPVSGDGLFSKEEVFDACPVGSLPFKEHNEKFPHTPYTLGFSGLGPSFYVNKRSNPTSREPCFATVVLGRETIDVISAMSGTIDDPTQIQPVDIISMRLIAIEQLSDQARLEYLAIKRKVAISRQMHNSALHQE